MGDYGQEQEEKERWRQKNPNIDNKELVFRAIGSSTHNPKGLSQVLSVLDLAIHQLSWDIPKKKIVKGKEVITRLPFLPSQLLNAYQAGIDGKYHNDLTDIMKLDEYIQKKALMRKAQMMQDNTLMT